MQNFTPVTGATVYWYPKAKKDESTVPHIGVITDAYSRGTANISIIPPYDGAVVSREQVYHISDERLIDGFGKPTPGALERGCWEYTPMSAWTIEQMEKPEEAEEKAPVKKTTAKKATS